jgi:hypothetical protein
VDSETKLYLAVFAGVGLLIAVLLERVSPRRPRRGPSPRQQRPRDEPDDLI